MNIQEHGYFQESQSIATTMTALFGLDEQTRTASQARTVTISRMGYSFVIDDVDSIEDMDTARLKTSPKVMLSEPRPRTEASPEPIAQYRLHLRDLFEPRKITVTTQAIDGFSGKRLTDQDVEQVIISLDSQKSQALLEAPTEAFVQVVASEAFVEVDPRPAHLLANPSDEEVYEWFVRKYDARISKLAVDIAKLDRRSEKEDIKQDLCLCAWEVICRQTFDFDKATGDDYLLSYGFHIYQALNWRKVDCYRKQNRKQSKFESSHLGFTAQHSDIDLQPDISVDDGNNPDFIDTWGCRKDSPSVVLEVRERAELILQVREKCAAIYRPASKSSKVMHRLFDFVSDYMGKSTESHVADAQMEIFPKKIESNINPGKLRSLTSEVAGLLDCSTQTVRNVLKVVQREFETLLAIGS